MLSQIDVELMKGVTNFQTKRYQNSIECCGAPEKISN